MKKTILILLLPLISSLVSSAWADVILKVPEDIQTIAVNGKKADRSEKIELSDGVNQVALHFFGEIGHSTDTEIESSDVFVIKFRSVNQILQLKIPKIKNEFALKKFNANPDIRLIDNAGTVLEIQIDKLEKAGFQVMRDFEKELTQFNQTNSPAALYMRDQNVNQQNRFDADQPEASVRGYSGGQINLPEMMLKYWYRQADEKTQKKFKEWMAR